MASNYPAALDTLATNHQSGDFIAASTDNDEADAINKIEAELGVDPRGAYTDVVSRLDANDAELGANPSGSYADVATRIGALETLIFNTQTGSAYTLILSDAGQCVTLTNATACTVTVPANASVAFPSGTQIIIRAGTGAGTITVSPAAGVTVTNPYASLVLAGPSAQAVLLKIGTNAWSLNGEVA